MRISRRLALYAAGNRVRLDKHLNSQVISGTPRWGISGVSIGTYGLAAHGGTQATMSNSLRRYGSNQVTCFNESLVQSNISAGTGTTHHAAAANSAFAFIGGGQPYSGRKTSSPISTVTTINPSLTVGSVTGLQTASCGLSAASLNDTLVFFFGGATACAATPFNYKTTVYDTVGTRYIAPDITTGINNISYSNPSNFGFSIGKTYAGIARQYGAEIYNASLTKSQISLPSNPSAECMSTKSYGIIPFSDYSAVAIDESLTVHNLGYGFPLGNACCRVKDVAVSMGGGALTSVSYSKAAYKVNNNLTRDTLTNLTDYHGGNPAVANVNNKFVICFSGAESGFPGDDSDTGYVNMSSKYDVYKV